MDANPDSKSVRMRAARRWRGMESHNGECVEEAPLLASEHLVLIVIHDELRLIAANGRWR